MATMTLEQQRALAVAQAKRKRAEAEGGQDQGYTGQLLPFSRDPQGNVSFDSNAGIVGAVKRAVTFPMDAMQGKVDPLSDEGIARAADTGLMFSPLGAATRGGLGWAGAKTSRTTAKTPTTAELKDAANFGYTMGREMGVDYDPRAVQNLMLQTRSRLFNDGVIEELAPKSFAILKKLERPPEGGTATISGLDAARRQLGQAAQDFANPTEQMAATRIIKALDQFVENPDAKAVVAGPATAAGGLFKDARGNYAAAKRSERVTAREDNADIQAAVTNSGHNVDNKIRGVAAAILKSDKLSAGFSPEELTMLRQVAEGTATRNVLREIGNRLGGGGGIAGSMIGGMGGYFGGLLGPVAGVAIGAGLPAVGVAARAAANRASKNALRNADEAIRQRSPLYKQRVETSPMTKPANPELRAITPRAGSGTMTPEQVREYEDFIRRKYALQQGA